MYDPAGNEDLIAMASMKMSPEMLKAFGFTITPNVSLTSFLASYLYGMLMIIIPMIYTCICANRLVAQHTDKGSMAFLLSAPISRKRIVATQALFLSVGCPCLYCAQLGIVCSYVFYFWHSLHGLSLC